MRPLLYIYLARLADLEECYVEESAASYSLQDAVCNILNNFSLNNYLSLTQYTG